MFLFDFSKLCGIMQIDREETPEIKVRNFECLDHSIKFNCLKNWSLNSMSILMFSSAMSISTANFGSMAVKQAG